MTQCCIVELYKLGAEHQHTVDIAKRFERRKCNHREAIEGDECVKSVVGMYSSIPMAGSSQFNDAVHMQAIRISIAMP